MTNHNDIIKGWTDSYFNRTRQIIKDHGDASVTYAIFMRRPVISAPSLALNWLWSVAKERKCDFEIELLAPEASWVGAGEPLLYISGAFSHLVDLETLLLQKIGPACVAAYNASSMCEALPNVGFMAMEARHCAGREMAELMSYAASVGSQHAAKEFKAKGFIGNATSATSHYFGNESGLGTMPHALIGYAGSTVAAAELFHQSYPDQPLTALVDYFGHEISDALAVCNRFPELVQMGRLSVRMDTTGGRFCEGLDPAASYAVLNQHAPHSIRGYRSESELHHLIGTGVSAAAIWYMRQKLDEAGYDKVNIVGSSGFGPEKCKVMGLANAPLNVIGTGSFLPERWAETYATADIIEYNGTPKVKIGREFLLRQPTTNKIKD